ncbi:hypothetical protein XM38_005310 [Halomicronema hongdechloris C2206]|uniref:Circadian input-output histidine kinase CikA n=1 Tax=Halomicronema hongdechloris C2206 TaxID=1641165 RepID=A0A1Z3HH37_9CYAN|nr:GAF domain-containing protein [Halomicronema hongdechloris]ASC69604.1 hypothetical protein XM38_005310 [Halomicronema hongdechloris C2206]
MLTQFTRLTQVERRVAIVSDPLAVSPDTLVVRAIASMSGRHGRYQTPGMLAAHLEDYHQEARSSCVVVVEDGQVVGILTEGDVLRLSLQQRPLETLQLHEVMTQPVVTLRESAFTDVLSAVTLLQHHNIQHLPLLNEQDRLVGLVTQGSLHLTALTGQRLRAHQQETLVADMALRVRQHIGLEAVANAIVQEVREFLAADRVIVYQFNPDLSGTIVAEAIVPPWIPALNVQFTDTCFQDNQGGGYREGRIFVAADIYAANLSECHVQLLERFQVRANLVVPIIVSDNETHPLWGLLVAHQCAGPRAWDEDDIHLLQQLSVQLAITLQQADLYHSLQTLNASLEEQVETRTRQLQALASRERLLARISTQIRSSLNLEAVLETAVHEIRSILQCDRINIWQLEAEGPFRVVAESTDSPLSLRGERVNDPCYQDYRDIYRQGRVRVVPDIYTTPMADCHREMLIGLQTRAKILVPLLCGETLWGLLNASESQHPRDWQPADVELMRTLGEQLAIAIQQATTHQELQTELQERQQAEARLQASEQRYASLAAAAPVGIFRADPMSNCLYVNDRWCQIAGLSPAAAAGQGWRQGLHPADRDRVITEWQRATQENCPFQLEYRFQRPDGTVTWVYGQVVAERDVTGQAIGYVGTITDISERKQAELTLQTLIQGTAATTGPDFFPALVSHMAVALNVSYALVTEWVDEELRTLSFWAHGRLQANFAYRPAKTPCERALQDGQFYCADSLQQRFPEDPDLVEMGAESYLGIALRDNQGQAIGNLCILSQQRIQDPERAANLLSVFAARAAAELERQRAMASLKQLNQALESKVAERTQELQHVSDKFQRLVDDIGEKFVVFSHTGPTGRLTYVSAGIAAVFGISKAEVLGQPWQQMFQWLPEDLDAAQQSVQRLQENQEDAQQFEMCFRHPDGSLRTIHVAQHAVRDAAAHLVAVEGIVEDITERKQAEAQLRQTNAELARATRLKDEFLANMSHELRTPLNAILGMTEGLQDAVFGEINAQQHKALQTIERSGSHLLDLINDILDLSKIESGRLELDRAPTAIAPLCQSSLLFIQQQALSKRLQVELKLPPNLPDLFVDERRIRQTLINLLSNAVKFTPAGGRITLKVSPLPREDGPEQQNCLRLAVIDTGIGIAPKNLTKLFQPFVQIDSDLNRQYEGTGLGLALVKRIVELHGGQVALTSEVGVGSCFSIDLPCVAIALPAPQPVLPSEPKRDSYHPRSGVSPLILLAEDNAANVSTLSSYLKAKGYQILVAHNGQEAIALAQANTPDLILMDIQMPVMDGLEATRQIRQDPNLARLPIIALTALAMPGDRERCLAAGASDYLIKPARLRQLVSTIHNLLAP